MAYIRIKNGSTGGLPTSLLTGEPAYSINDNKTYIGNGSSVVRLDAGSYTAECTTAAATADKVATCPGIILIKGVEVTVKFTADNTVAPASLTLNINNTGAWPILYRGSSLPSASVLSANRVYKFYYNGTSWELIGDLDTTVGAALSSHTGNSTIHITGAERTKWDGVVTDFGNLEIGGRNLWANSRTIPATVTIGQYGYTAGYKNISELGLKTGELITFSVYVSNIPAGERVQARIDFSRPDNTYEIVQKTQYSISNEGVIYVSTFVKDTSEFDRIRYRVMPVNYTANYQVDVLHEKLERGNKPTDWSPAPEDQVSDWNTTDVNSFSFIKNKPTSLSQFTDNIGVATHIANTSNPHTVTKAQVELGNVENITLSTWAGSSYINTLGTISTGTWNATTIAVGKGGTGKTSIASGKMLYASAANTYSELTTSAFGRGLLNAVSGTMVTGLNADQIDEYHAEDLWRTDNAGSSSYDWAAKDLNVAGYVQVGSARIVYVPADAGTGTPGYLKIQHSDGSSAMHLVTTGGQTMYSTGVPAGSGSGGATVILNGVTTDSAVFWAPTSAGSSLTTQFLKASGSGAPVWADFPTSWAWGNLTGIPSTFTPSAHTHDDRYYTETEINSLLANKANWDTAYGWGDHASAGYALNSAFNTHNTDNIRHITGAERTKWDGVVTDFAGLEIGGRNLIRNSNIFTTGWSIFGGAQVIRTPDQVVSEWQATDATRIETVGGLSILKFYKILGNPIVNDTRIISFWVKNDSDSNLNINFNGGTVLSGSSPLNLESGFSGRVIYNVRYYASGLQLQFRASSAENSLNFTVWRLQVEKGTIPTDWTPAPEDQVSDWLTTDVNSFSFIKNKPTLLSQFTDNIGVATHIANISNPHSVTKEQVGLGSVENTALSTYAGSTTQDWSAKSLTLAGAITGATTGLFSSTITANNFVASASSGFMFTASKATKYNGFSAPAGGGFIFLTNGEALTGSAALTILANRYVGINKADPIYNLDVTGTGYFSSNLSVGGTLGVTGNTTLSGTLGVTGATTLATASVTNQLNFGSSGKWINYDGSANLYDVTAFNLSIKHETPFIDFYFERMGVQVGDNWEGSSRIIERAAGVLDIEASVNIPSTKYLQIGSARLTYEIVDGVGFLKLAHSNGTTAMHLVTTGGQTMYSTGVPATGGGGGAIIQLNGATLGEGDTAAFYAPTTAGANGNILKSNGSGAPSWVTMPEASLSVAGITTLGAAGGAAAYSHTHSAYSLTSHDHSGVYALAAHNHYSIGDDSNALLLTGTTVTIHTDISPVAGFWKSDSNGTLSVDTNTYSLSSHTHDYLSKFANSGDFITSASAGYGIRFWNDEKYKIFMSDVANTTYGNRIYGDTTSDYNMYFRIGDGTNRGFVFESSYSVKLASINPSGIISNVGMTFNSGTIKGAVIDNYGVCSTAASTGAKTVTISGFRLATGVQVNIKFSNDNYAYPITMNVSGTGAKTIKAYGDSTEQDLIEQIKAGAIIPLVYDGTYWVIPTTPSMY